MQLPGVREGWHLTAFTAQFMFWLAIITWQEVSLRTTDGALETATGIGRSMGPAVVLSAAVTVIVVEGTYMLAERYLRRRFQEGKEEGLEEGREEGQREERHKMKVRLEAWNRRRKDAEKQGMPFDEPLPILADDE